MGAYRPASAPCTPFSDKETAGVSTTERIEAWSGASLPRWPAGTVRDLLVTSLVTEPTGAVLRGRLEQPVAQEPCFLSPEVFLVLRAACDRLIPQPERGRDAVDIAGSIDRELAEGRGNGWRYASMPLDGEAYQDGLRGIDETAWAVFGALFPQLDPARQDAVLAEIQAGHPAGAAWTSMPAQRFFEELLVLAAETYYAHPIAQEEIGYAGMADARGWQAIGLDEREVHEPASLPPAVVAVSDRAGAQTAK